MNQLRMTHANICLSNCYKHFSENCHKNSHFLLPQDLSILKCSFSSKKSVFDMSYVAYKAIFSVIPNKILLFYVSFIQDYVDTIRYCKW